MFNCVFYFAQKKTVYLRILEIVKFVFIQEIRAKKNHQIKKMNDQKERHWLTDRKYQMCHFIVCVFFDLCSICFFLNIESSNCVSLNLAETETETGK